MNTSDNFRTPIRWRCTTCGLQVTGYGNGQNRVRIECRRCHTVMIRTTFGRRHSAMEIFEPKDGWNPVSMQINRTLRTWDTTE